MSELPDSGEPENIFAAWELYLDHCESDPATAKGAIGCLLIAIFPSLFRRAFRYVRDHSTAEDLVQEASVRFLSRVEGRCIEELKDLFPDEARLRGYCYRILQSVLENNRNRVNKRSESPIDVGQEGIADTSRQEGEILAKGEMMRKAVQCLCNEDRTVIELYYFEDYTVSDMSDFLNITPGNVHVRLTRARARLRSIYQRLSGERN